VCIYRPACECEECVPHRRLGPQPVNQEEIDATTDRLVEAVKIKLGRISMVRAKFRLDAITNHAYGGTSFIFNAVMDDGTEENKRFSTATPSGKLEVWVNNPAAIEKFEMGKSYYLDFTVAP
jgi:hypothetical protein